MSTKDRDQIVTQHDLHHCRTKCYVKTTNFVWSIANFWNICNFMDTLTSSDIKGESYKINMCINRENNKLNFFIHSTIPNYKEHINIYRYNVYIKGTEGAILCADWKRFQSNTDSLYEVCFQTLQLNMTKYLPNNTLSIHFTFESYENVIHITMYENIMIETQKLTEAMNNFASDESNSFVTFIVDGKRLRVNKSSVCAVSSVFNKMLKKCIQNTEKEIEEEIEITDVEYSIFQIVIFYINTKNVFECKFDVNDDKTKKSILIPLLAAAHKFDMIGLKEMCEKYLISLLTKENAVIFLDIAISNDAVYLANYAKRFIKLHLDDIKYTPVFLEKVKINPEILLEIFDQEIFEEHVYLLHICKILYLDNLLMISLYTILISLSYAVITVVNRTLSSVSVGFVAARGLMRSARLCRTANVIV
ncbi:Protein maternal effect lethal 26 [Trachymyrmex zeteki]|uniref:Protein maternal effect lethal 26 n=1 Tax=Mycetomoellerius zeteki TaxID=64791 RepID=A0A151WPZ8_9HYME|nr:Protein maternal effect lethal 26 [Trachymyrmex zeteki]